VAAYPQSSQPPSSRSRSRISGFPPAPKSVRTWRVPASEESQAGKLWLSPTGNSTSPPQSFVVHWLMSRGFRGVFVLVTAITLLVLAVRQLMK
jgi:hypothetical protein